MRLLALPVVLALLLAGCAGDPVQDRPDADDPADPSPGAGTPAPSGSASATSKPTPGPGPRPDGPEPVQRATPQWGSVDSPLRPGTAAAIGSSLCTFDFLFFDPLNATYYVGLAGHCTDKEGQDVAIADGVKVGTVVFDSDDPTYAAKGVDVEWLDFSLVRLEPGAELQAHPKMRAFDGPTGIVGPGEAGLGDRTALYGHGLGVGSTEPTRAREGVLMFMDELWGSDMPTVFGDSGGPVLHVPTGEALGIVSGIRCCDLPPSTSYGPTVHWILEQLALVGFADLELALADGTTAGRTG